MPVRRTYWIAAAIFFMVVVVSRHRVYQPDDTLQTGHSPSTQKESYKPPYGGYTPPKFEPAYTGSEDTPPPPSSQEQKQQQQITKPNTSKQYDTLIVIPSSWTQIQSRRWVRDTIFGIKNNLTPCKTYDGRVIYKFFIHGRTTWLKSNIHTAQFMQAQVRELYAEFMEFDDWTFTNTTVADRHTVWGDALDWAVNTFVPAEKITVDKVLIFDSSTLVNLPKLEESVQSSSINPAGFIQTWGEEKSTTPFAGMVSFQVAQQLLKDRAAIKADHNLMDLLTAATVYYTTTTTNANNNVPGSPASFKITPSSGGLLWESDIGQVPATTLVVGQVFIQEDWVPLAEKLMIRPTMACAVDQERSKSIAVLTSSHIYVDMCMAAASLPSADNKRDYAKKHGYHFVARAAEFAQEEFRNRRPVWGKIGAIEKVLPHYEWLLWMDMDAVVVDMEKDVREIIRKAEEMKEEDEREISLIVARPVKDKMLNAGVMLIKNTEWSRRFWSAVQRKKDWYTTGPSYEQGAIWETMQEQAWAPGVLLFDKDDHTMNTFPKYYQEHDFIVHFAPAGCPAVPVLEALKRIKAGQSILGVGV
ncbi:hypothetical protein EDD11_005633 [Mortierella claussenii]|nr:hypothetical protein EDD11_005633 [Mortierella claussenii]